MGRAKFPCEFVQCVVSNEDAWRNVEHAVVCVELFDGGAPAGRVTLAEDLLKVSIEKFNNSLSHFVFLSWRFFRWLRRAA
jgi:hypothetical protein